MVFLGTIDRLGKKGLIERMSGADDERKTYIRLTIQGQTILESGASLLPVYFVLDMENNVPEWEKSMIISSFLRVSQLMRENGCEQGKDGE